MSTASLAVNRTPLIDRLVSRSLATDATFVVAGAAFTAVLAQVSIPLWPVPITAQTLAVLLVGSALGSVRGALSMTLYAIIGLVGVPVFTEASSGIGTLLGPTGGYIVGFIAAAALTGWLAERSWDRRFLKAALTFVGGTVVTFAFGLTWLSFALGLNLQETLAGGLYPFIIGGAIKAAVAAGLMPLAWKVADRRRK